MKHLQALRQRRADLIAEAQRMSDLAASEGNRLFNATELSREAEIDAEISSLNGSITVAERQADRMRTMPGAAAGGIAGSITEGNEAAASAGKEGEKFKSLGEQLMAIRFAGMPHGEGGFRDPRLSAGPTGMSEGVSSDGGFLVQTDFVNDLLQNLWTSGEIASRIRTIGIGPNSNGLKMNGLDETSRANGSRWGGVQAFWTGEAQLKQPSQTKLKQIEMNLLKLTGLMYATDELLDDQTALQDWMGIAFQSEFNFKVEDAIINGTGAGMPLGILSSGAVITVPKVTGQTGLTVNYANILAMWSKMPPASRSKCVWLVNSDTETQLWQLYTPVLNGTTVVGGIAAPASVPYMPPGANGNQYGTLMGRPVIPCEYAATLGTPGDIMLVDLSQYLGITKGGVDAASSIHVRFIYDETVFRWVYRFNGQPLWTTPITPYRGTNFLSPFVVLAARA